jgi:hypothetical protein
MENITTCRVIAPNNPNTKSCNTVVKVLFKGASLVCNFVKQTMDRNVVLNQKTKENIQHSHQKNDRPTRSSPLAKFLKAGEDSVLTSQITRHIYLANETRVDNDKELVRNRLGTSELDAPPNSHFFPPTSTKIVHYHRVGKNSTDRARVHALYACLKFADKVISRGSFKP